MNLSKKYWQNKRVGSFNAAPNVSLFRLLGEYGFNFENKKVLEIGFFHGADLMEFNKRKSLVYGLDINKNAVDNIKKELPLSQIKKLDCSKEKIPFLTKFDLIYSRDFIYYLNKAEMIFHFDNVYKSLKKGGLYLFQFLEKDLLIKKNGYTKYNFEKNYILKKFSEEKNPVKFYDTDFFEKIINDLRFKIVAKKFLIESYGTKEKKVRINKYLLCMK